MASQQAPRGDEATYQRLKPVPYQTDSTRESAICCLHDWYHLFGNRSVWSWKIWRILKVFPCPTPSTVPCCCDVECSEVKAWQACRLRWPQSRSRCGRVAVALRSRFPNFPPRPAWTTSPDPWWFWYYGLLWIAMDCYGLLWCFAGRNTSPHFVCTSCFCVCFLEIWARSESCESWESWEDWESWESWEVWIKKNSWNIYRFCKKGKMTWWNSKPPVVRARVELWCTGHRVLWMSGVESCRIFPWVSEHRTDFPYWKLLKASESFKNQV